MTDNFGNTPEDFDLDAWLDQGSRPQKTVKVYRDWSLMAELVALEEQIAAADAVEDPSMGDVSGEELREQYQAVLDKLAESAIEVTLRALTNEEVRDIAAGVPERKTIFRDSKGELQERWNPDQIAVGDALVAEATVSPKMNRAQIKKMRERLGDGPTLALYNTTTELRSAGQVLPPVPFSDASSDDSRG